MEETKHNTEMNLFNDPQILSIKNSLPPEYLEELRRRGESMYKDIDFENETINHVIQDSINNIKEAIKSGLHPSLLEPSEKELLFEELGKEWYKEFGYVEQDLDEIYTIKK